MTLEIPTDETIAYVYSREPIYPRCSNCKHLDKVVLAGVDYLYCINQDTKAYIEGGMLNPILKPEEWSCPLHQFKAEG